MSRTKLTGIVAAVLAVAVLLACGASSNAGSVVGTTTSGGGSTTTAKHFKVGDVVSVSGVWQITIASFKVVPGDDITQPAAGNQFAAFAIVFKNVSNQEQEVFGSADWKFADSTGQGYDSTIVDNVPQEPSGKVEAGQTVRGSIAYEVPKTQTTFTMAFQGTFLSSGQVFWDVSL